MVIPHRGRCLKAEGSVFPFREKSPGFRYVPNRFYNYSLLGPGKPSDLFPVIVSVNLP